MKTTQLRQRLTGLKVKGADLEIIKEVNLLAIKGGDCPNLVSCGRFTSCTGKYKSGDRDIDVTVNL